MKTNDNGINRDMTETEVATYEAWQKEVAANKKAKTKVAADKAKAKQTVLDRLGITADEAQLLIG